MGLGSLISNLGRRLLGKSDGHESPIDLYRICRVEELETRTMMTAAPTIQLGAVFNDQSNGTGTTPQLFYVTYDGGADNTQLTQLTINLNQNGTADLVDPDPSLGDSVFHTSSSAFTSANAYPVSIISASGITITNTTVQNDSTQLVMTFSNFQAGDTLEFSVGVATPSNTTNPVTVGSEMQNSQISANFSAPAYSDTTASATFYDNYSFVGTDLTDLPADVIPPCGCADQYFLAGAQGPVDQDPLPGSIAGISYVDNTSQGVYTAGDTLLSNVSVALLNSSGTQIATTTTDSNGAYSFTGLAPGVYSVRETQPTGYLPGTAYVGSLGGVSPDSTDLKTIQVKAGAAGVDYNFNVEPPNTLSGFVRLDTNYTQQNDPTDPPIAGVTIKLYTNYGKLVGTTTTAADGSYTFTNLVPCTYDIVEVPPSGYQSDADFAGSQGGSTNGLNEIDGVTLQGGVTGTNYNFYHYQPVSIAGLVKVDLDGQWETSTTDPLLQGVTITLLNSQGVAQATATTDANGAYSFTNLLPGSYKVVETVPSNYFADGDEVGSSGGLTVGLTELDSASLPSGTNAINYNFAVVPPSSIAGIVKVDLDGHWETSTTDPLLQGVTISLVNPSNGSVIATTTTDANGAYIFQGLRAGPYEVRETVPANYFADGDEVGSVGGTTNGLTELDSINLPIAVNATQYNFAVVPPASISGYVRVDTNGDHTNNPNDPPLTGVTVNLLDSNGNVVGTTTTNASGYYAFTNLFPGTYSVREVLPASYEEEDDFVGNEGGQIDGAGELQGATLAAGANGQNYNFYVVQPATLSGFVRIDETADHLNDSTDPPLAGVTVQLLDPQGNLLATTTTDATGAYAFTNLSPGKYSVRELTPSGYYEDDAFVGSQGGTVNGATELDGATLLSGTDAINYNFYVMPPGSISGYVIDNIDGLCEASTTDPKLPGVTINLLNSSGSVIASTVTNSAGYYYFGSLAPGAYSVQDVIPTGDFASAAHVGSIGGTVVSQTETSSINVAADNGLLYDFCIVPPGSISGYVIDDLDGLCEASTTDPKLPGVTIDLLDSSGNVIATTVTNSAGYYYFGGLAPGAYSVQDVIPTGDFAQAAHVGSLGGTVVSQTETTDVGIRADDGLLYDFCIVPPGSISGYVIDNLDGLCEASTTDPKLPGVTIDLLDSSGDVIATTVTDATGYYDFAGLAPGTYTVQDVIPTGDFANAAHVGSLGGTVVSQTETTNIGIRADDGLLYDFCIAPPSTISGIIKDSTNGDDCGESPLDTPLAGVEVELVDATGTVLAVTTTGNDGTYSFTGLQRGTYSVQEVVPNGYYAHCDTIGSVGGDNPNSTLLDDIGLPTGVAATGYNFCVIQPASLSGYVFQDGPEIPLTSPNEVITAANSGRTGIFVASDPRIAGVVLTLADANGNVLTDANGNPIQTTTDVNGYYQFTGLDPLDSYTVYEAEPANYIKGLDTAGSSGGVALNPGVVAPANYVGTSTDVLIGIPMMPGQTSVMNNFSVLQTGFPYLPPPPPQPAAAPAVQGLYPFNPAAATYVQQSIPYTPPNGGGYIPSGATGSTWHLSVVNAGQPRGESPADAVVTLTAQQRAENGWEEEALRASRWTLVNAGFGDETGNAGNDEDNDPTRQFFFGMRGGTPVTGDFNGDGVTDVGVFYRGQWFVDLNGNGKWDKSDLWAKLGYTDDQPLVGDWDGDGKADIGIFGAAWPGDPRAVAEEPGLPDPDNRNANVRKNAPPRRDVAPHGWRQMQRTSTGKVRADLIDHVFFYGAPGDRPIAGDWNGAGVDTIGIYRDGRWDLDVDGNGKWSEGDVSVQMGEKGDLPVIGDFNGDGTDEIGFYRNGTWHIDINGDRVIDDKDVVKHLGTAEDVPVVGDWDGDGKDDIGIYRPDGTRKTDK